MLREGVTRWRRRLTDFEDVAFEVPALGGTGDNGEVLTGSQQAAAFFNKLADRVRREGGDTGDGYA